MSLRPVRHPGELRWETRLLATVTAILVVFGVAATYGAASLVTLEGQNMGLGFALRQLSGALAGAVLLLLASRLDYYRWRQLAWPLLGVTLVLLLIPLLPITRSLAPLANGARRWVDIGPFNFQPSELARVVVVIWCAMLASKKGDQVREFKKGVLPFIVVLGLVSILILFEPNLSMATLVALLGGLVLFTSGAKIGHFVLLAGLAMILVFHQIRDVQYRLARLLTFLNPGDATTEAGFQIHQSLVGIGSGQLFGVGFGQGQQKLGYLPYAYSDFLFSTIGEEWGFLGLLVVVSLFALFCWLGFRI
ncbi:MAG TPA: FtsW/RodA/SpoVE family cell cycle protein, partial [Gemmatimonadales bacterium]|nr:FtsW/RodA/SpoVE family cell cycle protein [Gemmatimonadales bacterium]